ncbi:MAG: helix-hairpin-helix domain-containing protein [Proteobacteria bacterium]|nr:helix-hairpin-helix domain-containing protein [Pseudomonadota bacterium]MBU4298273.1 helix-hairpin-helix domain-containing protein [Pseudomonadota bacterium]MCG2747541.1 helix-hairpin-helix domain-containing protein [Desulfobulbaceae bacterium]
MNERNHNNNHPTGNRDYRIMVLLVVGFVVGFISFVHNKTETSPDENRQNRKSAIWAATLLSPAHLNAEMRPFVFLPVPLNSADKRLLETIPGIGPRLAERIIGLRSARKGFQHIEELLAVEGIGPQKFAAIKKYCSL